MLATSASALGIGVWYYIELKHIVADAGGVLEVRINGTVWATYTGDTKETANATLNQLGLGYNSGSYVGTKLDIDDLYANDANGSAPYNTYLGEQQVFYLPPSGAGNYTELTTLFGAATHREAVDEIVPNEDTDYVESPTADQRDTFAMTDMAAGTYTVNAVQHIMRVKEITAGARHIARMYRSGGSDDQGSDIGLSVNYAYILEIMQTDPIAVSAWTKAVIDAAEFGFRVR